MLLRKTLDTVLTPQPKNIWQHRPRLFSQLRTPRLPPLHTVTADTGANTLETISTIFVELWNLQYFRPQLRGTYDVVEDFLVSL